MVTHITLDRSGRITIPKPLWKELRLGPGNKLQIEVDGECITLRPARSRAILKKARGVWVCQSEPTTASIPNIIDRERERRRRELMR